MGGARALIASVGASISLVAGAAVSLLLLSVFFALPGFTGGDDGPGRSAAVEIAAQVSTEQPAGDAPARQASAPVLISAPQPARDAAGRETRASHAPPVVEAEKPEFDSGVPDLRPPPPPPPAAPASADKPPVGERVRDLGDVVTATVKGTGAAAAPLLGPPVSTAIQDVLDLLTSVLQGATSALGGALDKTVPR